MFECKQSGGCSGKSSANVQHGITAKGRPKAKAKSTTPPVQGETKTAKNRRISVVSLSQNIELLVSLCPA